MNFDLSSIDWGAIDFSALQAIGLIWVGRILSALAVFLVGKWLARRVVGLLAKVLERSKVDVTLTKFLNNIVYYAIIIAVIIAAAGQLGVNTASFLTVVGAASLAIGLALKDSLGNFASGVMLILFRPFRVGDAVSVGGETGVVQEITIFNTVMNTGDNQRKIIPNSSIGSGVITNITANPTRRIDMVIGISYDDDIRMAKETLEEILAANDKVLKEPAPLIAVAELGASSVDLVVRPWVKTDDYWDVKFALTEAIKRTFDEKGISFPFPQTDVHVYTSE